MHATKIAASLLLLFALAACGPRNDPDEENRQLDNAAHMLDAPGEDTANEEAALGNGEDADNAGNETGNGQ
jgi:hypothetical protein